MCIYIHIYIYVYEYTFCFHFCVIWHQWCLPYRTKILISLKSLYSHLFYFCLRFWDVFNVRVPLGPGAAVGKLWIFFPDINRHLQRYSLISCHSFQLPNRFGFLPLVLAFSCLFLYLMWYLYLIFLFLLCSVYRYFSVIRMVQMVCFTPPIPKNTWVEVTLAC